MITAGLMLLALGPAAGGDHIELARTDPLILEMALDGEDVQLLLDLASPGFVVLNGAVEDEIGLLANPVLSRMPISIEIDGERLPGGKTGRTPITYPDGSRARGRIIWFEGHDLLGFADGVIGPGRFDHYDSLTLQLAGSEIAGEVDVFQFPGVPGMAPEIRVDTSIGAVDLSFSLIEPSSVDATAYHRLRQARAVDRAEQNLTNEAMGWFGDFPAVHITNRHFGLAGLRPERFVRHLRSDERARLAERLSAQERASTMEEITVIAQRPDPNPGRPARMIIGRDILSACQTLHFDFQEEETLLTCPAGRFRIADYATD